MIEGGVEEDKGKRVLISSLYVTGEGVSRREIKNKGMSILKLWR